ncbi:D-alanine--D-alanine ligase family protein [Bdellovibrionota bacterium FG-1]
MKTGVISKRIRVAVLYGGRSGEHEVSLRSAASVIRNLNSARYEVIPVAIDKQGRWHLNDLSRINASVDVLTVFKDAPTVVLPPNPGPSSQAGTALVHLGSPGPGKSGGDLSQGIDVVFPAMHGTFCEDGTLQGLLELADVAYVGCGVLASAVGMDKEVAKRLVAAAGIPVVPWVAVRPEQWKRHQNDFETRVAAELGYPCFVKPANAGSSVGVHKVKAAADLAAAVQDAFRYDTKILIERGIAAREIELSALENPVSGEPALVSVAGEVTPSHEFYSYEAKYLDENGAALMIPARLSEDQMQVAQKIARDVFQCLECEGMARVDLFLDKQSGGFYFNEINTLPGFTSISMYPKMWEASGIPYQELLSRLIDLAISRHERKKGLVRDFEILDEGCRGRSS